MKNYGMYLFIAVIFFQAILISELAAEANKFSDFNNRFDVKNEYQNEQGASYENILTLKGEYALSKTKAVGLTVPVVTKQPNVDGQDADFGIGDIGLRYSHRLIKKKGYRLIAGAEYEFDSAVERNLGSDKNIAKFFTYASIKIPKKRAAFFPYFTYNKSVGGKSDRSESNYSLFSPFYISMLSSGYYYWIQSNIFVNHLSNDRVGLSLELEYGRFIKKDLMIYIRPGFGILGDNLPQINDNTISVGFRHWL